MSKSKFWKDMDNYRLCRINCLGIYKYEIKVENYVCK